MPHLSCLIWLTLCLQTTVLAQTNPPRITLEAGMTTVACRKGVKVYPEPNQQSMPLGYILMGEEVYIQERIQLIETFDDIQHYWYKVKVDQVEGYILGAHLAAVYFKTANGMRNFLHFIKPVEGYPGELYVAIKAVRKVGEEPFDMQIRMTFHANDMLKAKVFHNRGLKNYDQVIILERWVDQCPYYFQEMALLYRGKSIIPVFADNISKTTCTAVSYVFPKDYGGIQDVILVKTQSDTAAPKWIKFREDSNGRYSPVRE